MSKQNFILLLTGLIFFSSFLAKAQSEIEDQQIYTKINVKDSFIEVSDHISLPKQFVKSASGKIEFYLNKNLKISKVKGAKIQKTVNTDPATVSYVNKYVLTLNNSENSFTLNYSGEINDAIQKTAAEYARGFSETKGVISETGIYLANSTYWLPKFKNQLLSTFKITTEIAKDWSVVTQGTRTKNDVIDNRKVIVYNSPEPMDEIYLVGARWTEYSQQAGDVLVQAFLRTPDQKLAYKYLGITSAYLKMYETLIGKYPYTKFALVENFWETGYGMPSFTLLGEKVMRFPWIIYSSYPHELLHNYWGNGVFVNYDEGNWCEGITAYMADHLLQEQRGQGASYRRSTLQKFTDYVNEENDMPVNKFLNRNNAAEEAIGYGKVLMINNMLRYVLGDEIFIRAYQKFYKDNLFKKVSFPEIQKSFEEVSGKDLGAYFKQWTGRKGAPTFSIKNVRSKKKGDKYVLSFTLNQVQNEDVFAIQIPVAIFEEDNNEVVWKNVWMEKRDQTFNVELDLKPLLISVDPQFELMRRVSRGEVPASLSQVFGNKELTIIVPSEGMHIEAYQKMAQTWKSSQEAQGKSVTIIDDKHIKELPSDRSVWVLGFENKWYQNALSGSYKSSFSTAENEKIEALLKNGALIYTLPNSKNLMQTIGFAGANSDKSIEALTGKLLHYGKYGYLGFEGDDAKNVLKGSMPVLNSPLNVRINDGKISAKLKPRKALYQAKGRPRKPSH